MTFPLNSDLNIKQRGYFKKEICHARLNLKEFLRLVHAIFCYVELVGQNHKGFLYIRDAEEVYRNKNFDMTKNGIMNLNYLLNAMDNSLKKNLKSKKSQL